MGYSVALSTLGHQRAKAHLLRQDGQEDLCFALWRPSQGADRTTALIHDLVLPVEGERHVHGNASFLPHYFERALALASASNSGLAFMHSHPIPGWQGMSQDDIDAEEAHAAAAFGATGLPLVGLTLGTDGAWSARFWQRRAPRVYERCWCSTVRVAGDALEVTYHPRLVPAPRARRELLRTVAAWGESVQAHLARLHVGIVGLGSVGSVVSEAMARMGIAHVRLLDFDRVERHNLDRLLHATAADVKKRRLKVEVLARALRKSATARPFAVDALPWSIVEEEGYRAALDCDVLFSCVDRPWPRSVLNFIAYAHLIPVIDGGIFVERNRAGTRMVRADWRSHVAAPGRRCLQCLEQYDPGLVAAERDGWLDDPAYIAGLPAGHILRRNENVFAFSLGAASELTNQFISMVTAPGGVANTGARLYHLTTGTVDVEPRCACEATCAFPSLVARGDRSGMTVTGRHPRAEAIRNDS